MVRNRFTCKAKTVATRIAIAVLAFIGMPSQSEVLRAEHGRFLYGIENLYCEPQKHMFYYRESGTLGFDTLRYSVYQGQWSDQQGYKLDYQNLIDSGYHLVGLVVPQAEYVTGADTLLEAEQMWRGKYFHWEAEDNRVYESVNTGAVGCSLQVFHRTGRLNSAGTRWEAVPGLHSPDTLQSGPFKYLTADSSYWVEFRLQTDTVNHSDDSTVVAILSFATTPTTLALDTVFRSDFDSLIQSFQLYWKDSWGIEQTTGHKLLTVYWPGQAYLALDWVRLFNEHGRALVGLNAVLRNSQGDSVGFDPGDTLTLHAVKKFYSKYDDVDTGGSPFVLSTTLDEWGIWNIERVGVMRFLDSLLEAIVPGFSIHTEFPIGTFNRGDASDLVMKYYLANGFKYGPPEIWPYLDLWGYEICRRMCDSEGNPCSEEDPNCPTNVPCDSCLGCDDCESSYGLVPADEVEAVVDTLNHQIQALKNLNAVPGMDTTNTYVFITVDPSWSNIHGLIDSTRFTPQELQALTYLPIIYGAEGVLHYPYIGGGSFGMDGLRNRSDTQSASNFYERYFTVRDSISPFMNKIIPTLSSVKWLGGNFPDSVVLVDTTFVVGYQSDKSPAHVDVALFDHPNSTDDYFMLLNKRTADTTQQSISVVLDVGRFASSATMYYLIDVSTDDTLLAGPLSNKIVYNTALWGGQAKLVRITGGPDYVAGTSFPQKWWGSIHATEGATVGSDRSLSIAPGSSITIHTQCGYQSESYNDFIVNGSLSAIGTPDSPIVFDMVYDGPAQGTQCGTADTTHWGGICIASGTLNTLSYCQINRTAIAAYSVNVPVILDHVTTTNTLEAACSKLFGAAGTFFGMTDCNFDADVTVSGGTLAIDGLNITGGTNGLWLKSGATYTVRDLIISGFTTTGLILEGGSSGTVDNAFIDGSTTGIGLRISSAGASLDSITIVETDTALFCDPGSGNTVNARFFRAAIADKGVVARSGVLALDSCRIVSTGLSAIDAFSGTALLRMDSCYIKAPSQAADVSIGTGARLVARRCTVDSGWIGMEIYGKQKDSILSCRLVNNELYGLRFDTSDVADYTYGNLIVNDSATAVNMGYYVNRQSIVSMNDTIKGGYNWDFNFYSAVKPNLKATVYGMHMTAKPGDIWGLVLNGPSSSYDSAFVTATTVDSIFDGAHIYLRWLHAKIEDCDFESTLDPLTSSSYGIKDMGSTTGQIRCTRSINMGVDCVYRASGSAISYGEAGSPSTYGNNTFRVTDTLALPYTKYFHNLGASVKAEKNWWGKATPNPSRFLGTVDYTPALTTGPICEEGGISKLAAALEPRPSEFALNQNAPNPFNPSTLITFELPSEQEVRIEVFNTLGQRVKIFELGTQPSGQHQVLWNGRGQQGQVLGSGVYFYRITMPDFAATRSMVLLK